MKVLIGASHSSRHCTTSMRFFDNSSVHGDDYDIKETLAGHLLLDSVRPRHCCEVWSFLMLEGWRGGVAGADIRSDQVMYSD